MENNKSLSPFIKWAGGKRQLLNEIKLRMPLTFERYFEPFLGGAAVLFEITPKFATVNDINSNLINTYNIIKDNPYQLINLLNEWDKVECDNLYYYHMREKYNDKIKNEKYDIEMAALFIYLNKRCFNGLYRVNKHGLFNVPFNGKKNLNSIIEENILNISEYLKTISILNTDFEQAVKDAKKNDFIFFDSPYDSFDNKSFTNYTKNGFSTENHIRLANLFKKLDKKGCHLMLTNHNTKLINDLYKDYKIEIINAKRMINSNANNRIGQEVIITNYE